MRNSFLSALVFSFAAFTFCSSSFGQDSYVSVNSIVELDEKKSSNILTFTETETDRTYRLNIRFNHKKSTQVRSYLDGLLGSPDKEIGGLRLVWNHLPDGASIEGLEITLRDGHLSIRAKDGCCPGDVEELKNIGEDVKSMLK